MKFPTMAQIALASWRTEPLAKSLREHARRLGATIHRNECDGDWALEYVFDDDSALLVRGRGRHHEVVAALP